MNWRGRPSTGLEVTVSLKGSAAANAGPEAACEADDGERPAGIKVSEEESEKLASSMMVFMANGTALCLANRTHLFFYSS
jgi:hypothetical protein